MGNVILRSTATISMAAFLAVPIATAQSESEERQFREMVAYLKSNAAERKTAIATCLTKGIGDNPTGAARVMGVPVEEAATTWCRR